MARVGRKRKMGQRSANGRLIPAKRTDFKALAGEQPHRVWLPEHLRTAEKAGTPLGCLNLLERITDEQYEAGRLYGVRVGLYRAQIGTPRALLARGRGQPCNPEACQVSDEARQECACWRTRASYDAAFEALTGAGRKALLTVNSVAIGDESCAPADVEHLKCGLDALCRHFGVTARPAAKAAETKSWRA